MRPKQMQQKKGSITICQMNTAAFKRVNQKIIYYLDRLPLEKQEDIVALTELLDEQERLFRVRFSEKIPCRVSVFNDNERYRACHLRNRFQDAYHRGKIRPQPAEDEDDDQILEKSA